ncbi:hypothetical protein QFC21_005302 [Naganishia friedmannii]|uniref:Uncharacterized protein n=1 Tax=Naganishia friedmannii TaxID=89922 RepID=A0ACC2VAJ2_9TREE|nr:hypothetical protein QFC21_005302 [Naganishia friedmannii]
MTIAYHVPSTTVRRLTTIDRPPYTQDRTIVQRMARMVVDHWQPLVDHGCHNRAGGLGSGARRDADRLKRGLIPDDAKITPNPDLAWRPPPPPPHNPVLYRLHHFRCPPPSTPAPPAPVPTPAPPIAPSAAPSTPRAEDQPMIYERSTPASPSLPPLPWLSPDSQLQLSSPLPNPISPLPRSPLSPMTPNLDTERAAALDLLSFGREATAAAASAFATQYGGDPYDYNRAVEPLSASRSLRLDKPIENDVEASDSGLNDHQNRGNSNSGGEQAVDVQDGAGDMDGGTGGVEDPDGDENDMALDSEDGDPYPLEGKYRDEKDREALYNLPEVGRELILAERLGERQILIDRLAVDALYRATQVGESKVGGTKGAGSEDEDGTDDSDEDGSGGDDGDGSGDGNVDEDADPVGGDELGENIEDDDGDEGQVSEVGEACSVPTEDRLIEGQGKYFRKDDLSGYKIKMTVRTMVERKRTEILMQAYRHCGGNTGIFAHTGSSGMYRGLKDHWIANPPSDLDQGIINEFKRSNVAFL